MKNRFKDLAEKLDKRPLGKSRCKGRILFRGIFLKRDIKDGPRKSSPPSVLHLSL
jgi:hypothetical protein